MTEIGTTLLMNQLMNAENPAAMSRALVGKFERALSQGRFARFMARLLGRSSAMITLDTALKGAAVLGGHSAGLQSIAVDKIHGSESRSHDFDRNFNPLSTATLSRWVSVARARQTGIPLPPIELIEVNGTYFVRDGHHRVSVARSLGERYIEAEVTVWEAAAQSEKSPAALSLPTASCAVNG